MLLAFMCWSPARSPALSTVLQDTPTTSTESEIHNHLRKAREAYDAGNYAIARKESSLALTLNNELPEGFLLLGMTYWQEGKKNQAIDRIRKSIQFRPGYGEAHYFLSIIYWKTGDRIRARQEIEAAITHGVRLFDAYYLSGQAYVAEARWTEATGSFEAAALLLPPNHPNREKLRTQIDAVKQIVASRLFESDPGFVRAALQNNPVVRYTEEARRNKVQGSVQLAIEIDRDGIVSSTVVLLGLPHGLDDEAVRVARSFRFKPATRNGTPVPSWKPVLVEFHLR